MPDFKPETQSWQAAISQAQRPYGKKYYGRGIEIMSAVTNAQGEVTHQVFDEGTFWWKIVNPNRQPLRIPVQVCLRDSRIRWQDPPLRGQDDVRSRERVWGVDEGALFFEERNWTARFVVVSEGMQTVDTHAPGNAQDNHPARTEFTVKRSAFMKRDWLGFLAEAAKGLPGGQLLIGPLLRLYDQERQADERRQWNERVQQVMDRDQAIDAEILLTATQSAETTREVQMAFDVASPLLEDAAVALRENRPYIEPVRLIGLQLEVSRFPLPFGKQLLIDELAAIFNQLTLQEFKDCLIQHQYEIPNFDAGPVEVVATFVQSMIGQGRTDKLKRVMQCLHQKRQTSQILHAAVEFLS